jgi:hypothetical protein
MKRIVASTKNRTIVTAWAITEGDSPWRRGGMREGVDARWTKATRR